MSDDVYEEWNEDENLEKIKVCPFCGGDGILRDNGFEAPVIDDNGAYTDMDIEEADILWCECKECGAMARTGDTPEEAISNWNRRADNETDRC